MRIWFALMAGLLVCGCSAKKSEAEAPAIGFRDVAQETGLAFTHVNGAEGKYYMPEIMGSGAAILDYDGDGDLDVFLVQGGALGNPAAGSGNKLFRNELIPEGKLRFVDKTAEAGLGYAGFGMGAATGDFNNDGRPDLLVTNFGGNVLYVNLGSGKFRDVTAESPGVRGEGAWSTSASFFDYDRDGWQDLVILSYVDFSIANNKKCFAASGEPDYCTPVAYRPVAARLFHNDKGKFTDVTARAGLDRAKGPGLGVEAIDANRDGWPDLFVANDTAANHLWINQKDGTFVESALLLGVAYDENGLAKAGMGVAAGDYDGDGMEDLLVLNLMREGATLFRNEGTGYRDVSLVSRVHALTFAFTGFGVGWFDADNDGRLDLFLANGAVSLRDDQRGQPFPYRERNLLLKNNGPGEAFADVTDLAGEVLGLREVTRGAAFGDLNGDGRVDILVTNNGGPARLLLNESSAKAWMGVAVAGKGMGIGWRVGLETAAGGTVWKRVHTDGSYLSASSPVTHFGLGAGAKPRKIVWERGDGVRGEKAVDAGALGTAVVLRVGE